MDRVISFRCQSFIEKPGIFQTFFLEDDDDDDEFGSFPMRGCVYLDW